MSNEINFGKLGSEFQQTLLKSIIEDRKYGEAIIEVVESKYFDNNSFKFIMENIKEHFNVYNKIPDYITLSQKISKESGSDHTRKINLDTLEQIKSLEAELDYVQDTAMNFCKQQNLRETIKRINVVIDNGDFENYNKIEEMLTESLQVGILDDDVMNVFDDIDETLEDIVRQPIPTGIDGIDSLLKGGLGIGELGLIIAPTGVGKTSLLTKFANTAHFNNKNALQIYFEDDPSNIKRKHYTLWSEMSPDEQIESLENKALTKTRIIESQAASKGYLKMIKYPSGNVTINTIKIKLRKLISEGNKPDLLVIDYIDCIAPEKTPSGEEWKGEGSIIRSLEAMCYEFKIAIWTATQGNRCLSLDTKVDIKDKGIILIKNVSENDEIMTHKGYKKITHKFPIEKQSVYKIKLKSGKEIKCSSKHIFPTTYKQQKSIESGLKVGDKLYIRKE